MTETHVLLTGLAFPESPRWRDGRAHVSDWGAGEVHAVAADGSDEIVAKGTAFPMCIDFLPDGRMLVVHGPDLLVREADGALAPYADLASLAEHAYNDITVDGHGNVFVNNIGFEFPGGDPQNKDAESRYADITTYCFAGATGNGVLQAACDKGIYGIGVDVDQFVSTPDTAKLHRRQRREEAQEERLGRDRQRIADGTGKGGGVKLDITTDDVGLSSFHDFESLITPEHPGASTPRSPA